MSQCCPLSPSFALFSHLFDATLGRSNLGTGAAVPLLPQIYRAEEESQLVSPQGMTVMCRVPLTLCHP